MADQSAEMTLFALACVFSFITLVQLAHGSYESVRLRRVKPSSPRLLIMSAACALFVGHLFALVTAIVALRLDPNAHQQGLTKTSSALLTTFTIFFQGIAALLLFLSAKSAVGVRKEGAQTAFTFRKSGKVLGYINETIVVLWLLVIIAHSITLPFISDPLFSKSQDDLAMIMSLDCIVDTFGWAFSALSILASCSIIYSCLSLYRQLQHTSTLYRQLQDPSTIYSTGSLNSRAVKLLALGVSPVLAIQAVLILIVVILSKTLPSVIELSVAYFALRGVTDVAVVWLVIFAVRAAQGSAPHSKLNGEL